MPACWSCPCMNYQKNYGQTLHKCKQGEMPFFAPPSQIKGLDCSLPLPLGSRGVPRAVTMLAQSPVVGNHKLDANCLHFHASLRCSWPNTLLDACCPPHPFRPALAPIKPTEQRDVKSWFQHHTLNTSVSSWQCATCRDIFIPCCPFCPEVWYGMEEKVAAGSKAECKHQIFFSKKNLWNRRSYSETVIKGPESVFAALGKGEAGEGEKRTSKPLPHCKNRLGC